MFHQVEGIYVDENITFANLKDLIHKILHNLFGNDVEIRFRPSYFPLQSHQLKLIFYLIQENGLKYLAVELLIL